VVGGEHGWPLVAGKSAKKHPYAQPQVVLVIAHGGGGDWEAGGKQVTAVGGRKMAEKRCGRPVRKMQLQGSLSVLLDREVRLGCYFEGSFDSI